MGSTACKAMTVYWGPQACIDRDCDDYLNEQGDDLYTVPTCSHLKPSEGCSTHSTTKTDGWGEEAYDHVEPWPCAIGGAQQ